jgi:sugar (pentulose or hexulose) kinase
MSYLAIDIGSSFIKAAILEPVSWRIGQFQSLATPARCPHPNARVYEVSLDDIMGAVRTIIRSAVAANPDLRGLLLSTQTHGFVLANAGGEAVTPYISWQDTRCLNLMPGSAESALEQVRQRAGEDYRRVSGIFLKPGLALPNLFALRQSRPELSRVGGGLRFCTLGSYVISQLTGRHAGHLTNAAATGMVDLAQRDWNRSLIEAMGFGNLQFPELVDEFESCGVHEVEGHRLAVFPDIGDHHAALLGTLIEPERDVCCNIATAAQMTTIAHTMTEGLYEVRPFFDGDVLNTLTGLPGGRCLDVLVDWVRDVGEKIFNQGATRADVWLQLNQLDIATDARGLEVKTGFFEGTIGVETGSIEHITATNLNTANIFAAAYENIGTTYGSLINRFASAGAMPERIVFCGGVARKNVRLRQAITSAMGLPGELAALPQEVFWGLFRLSLVIEGMAANITQARGEILRKWPQEFTIENTTEWMQ